MTGTLFLLPALLGDTAGVDTLSVWEIALIKEIKHYFAENERSARRFLRKAGFTAPFEDINIHHSDKDTPLAEQKKLLKILLEGSDAAILPEAGCPGIADPGAVIVKLAHEAGITVVPVPGPSAIFLTLMGSGMNGQHFSFNGYLPVERSERAKAIRELESVSAKTGYTQLFIETPYRNRVLAEDLLSTCNPRTRLCIGVNLTGENAFIRTLSIQAWQTQMPDLHKRPAVFAISAEN